MVVGFLLELLAPVVTAFSSALTFNKMLLGSTGGGFLSSVCCQAKVEEVEGLVDTELRLRQTIMGADCLCLASNESDLSR